MGQTASRLLGELTRSTEPFPLKNAPLDVLLMIADYLDPVTYISLAITCKSFYRFLHKKRQLDGEDRRAFIKKLERVLGDQKWYCHFCGRLHPFRPTSSPTDREMWPDAERVKDGILCFRKPCRYERLGGVGMTFQSNSCGGSTSYYNLGWHHARLVMNRHLFGAPHGLPLSNLCRRFADPDIRKTPSFIQDWSARIVGDELLLEGVHIWLAREPPPNDDGTSGRKRGRTPFNRRMYFLCPHTLATLPPSEVVLGHCGGLEGVPELMGYRTLEYTPCSDVLHSCDRCLTDYVVTIRRVAAPEGKKTGSEAAALDQLRRATVRQIRRALGLGMNRNTAGNRGNRGAGGEVQPLTKTMPLLRRLPPDPADAATQESGWLVTIKTYHQFGKCRSPFDHKWMALTSDPRHSTQIPNRSKLRYPEGSVKRMWNQSPFADYWDDLIGKPRFQEEIIY